MPLMHCNACHHEWEGVAESRCGWCGSDGYVLAKATELERTVESLNRDGIHRVLAGILPTTGAIPMPVAPAPDPAPGSPHIP